MAAETPDWNDLKKKSAGGAVINLISQPLKFLLLFVNQIIMARLLTPADFGLVAMVAPVMAFVVLFADLGLSQASIQRAEMSQKQLSFLFWVNLGVASTWAAVMIGIAPLLGWFYSEPRVVPIAAIMGSTLIFSGLSAQHIALLTRNIDIRKLATLDIGSLIAGFIAGSLAALAGCGYWSLVVVHTVLYLTNACGAWCFSPWRPSLPKLPSDWKSLMRFGGHLSGFNFANYFARNLDNILIGRFNGEIALGLYDRAYKLLLMPLLQINQPFSRIALPLLSRSLDDPRRYRQAYFRIIELIIWLTYPGILFNVIESENIIRLVLGEKWTAVAPIFAILGASGVIAALSWSTNWLFLSQNRTRDMRNWGVFSSLVTVAAFALGLPWGPIGVATCYFTATFLLSPLLFWYVTRKGPITWRDMLEMALPFLSALIIDAICLKILSLFLSGGIGSLLLELVGSYMIFILSALAWPRGRHSGLELWRHGKMLILPYLAKWRTKAPGVEEESF